MLPLGGPEDTLSETGPPRGFQELLRATEAEWGRLRASCEGVALSGPV